MTDRGHRYPARPEHCPVCGEQRVHGAQIDATGRRWQVTRCAPRCVMTSVRPLGDGATEPGETLRC